MVQLPIQGQGMVFSGVSFFFSGVTEGEFICQDCRA